MSRLAAERENLRMATGHIAKGERRVAAQRDIVEALRDKSQETGEAERLLSNLEDTLAGWREHRDLIEQEIARLENQEIARLENKAPE